MAEVKRGRPTKPKTAEAQESERSKLVEAVKEDIKRKPTKCRTTEAVEIVTETARKGKVQSDIEKGYRDERGVRIQKYKRYKEGRDYEAPDGATLAVMADSILNNLQRYSKRMGQPPKYEHVEDFMQSVMEYMEYISEANKDEIRLIPDVEGLAAFMLISRETLMEWERTRDANYSASIKMVKNQFAYYKKQLAITGKTPALVFATDFNNNHGYTQKQEIEVRASNPLGDAPDQKALAERAAQDMGIDFTEVNGE